MKQLKPDAVTRYGIRYHALVLKMPADLVAEAYRVPVSVVQKMVAGLKPRDDFDDLDLAALLKVEIGDGSRQTYLYAHQRAQAVVMRYVLMEVEKMNERSAA